MEDSILTWNNFEKYFTKYILTVSSFRMVTCSLQNLSLIWDRSHGRLVEWCLGIILELSNDYFPWYIDEKAVILFENAFMKKTKNSSIEFLLSADQ